VPTSGTPGGSSRCDDNKERVSAPVDGTGPSVENGVVTQTFTTKDAPMAQEYVVIDLDRQRSVIYRMGKAGDKIA
jgi:hypothetical protein